MGRPQPDVNHTRPEVACYRFSCRSVDNLAGQTDQRLSGDYKHDSCQTGPKAEASGGSQDPSRVCPGKLDAALKSGGPPQAESWGLWGGWKGDSPIFAAPKIGTVRNLFLSRLRVVQQSDGLFSDCSLGIQKIIERLSHELSRLPRLAILSSVQVGTSLAQECGRHVHGPAARWIFRRGRIPMANTIAAPSARQIRVACRAIR